MSDRITENYVCPHCGGMLAKTSPNLSWQYDCCKCARGWKIDEKGTWHACFDAGHDTYDIARFNEAQKWRNHKAYVPYTLEIYKYTLTQKVAQNSS